MDIALGGTVSLSVGGVRHVIPDRQVGDSPPLTSWISTGGQR